jgi:hypothetical protein
MLFAYKRESSKKRKKYEILAINVLNVLLNVLLFTKNDEKHPF